MQRIVVLTDHAVTAEAVGGAIERHHGLRVLGTGTRLDDLTVPGVQPDVAVLQRASPHAMAASLGELRAAWPATPVVVLDGVSSVEALVGAIRAATGDLTVLTAASVARAREQLRSSASRSPMAGYGQLTRREREVLARLSTGASPSSIAESLGISLNTCRGYLRTLMAKLGVRSQREVVAFVAAHGLPPEGS